MRIPLPRKHWTSRYLVDRLALAAWQRRFPDKPWLPRQAIDFLEQWLDADDDVVEFGAGRSTIWFAARVARLASVEHQVSWHAHVTKKIEIYGGRAVCTLADSSVDATVAAAKAGMDRLGIEAPHLILVDGKFRDACALWALETIRPGGLLVIDNAERYLLCPHALPESRGGALPPKSEKWSEFVRLAEQRRRVWFSNGVTATAVVFC